MKCFRLDCYQQEYVIWRRMYQEVRIIFGGTIWQYSIIYLNYCQIVPLDSNHILPIFSLHAGRTSE